MNSITSTPPPKSRFVLAGGVMRSSGTRTCRSSSTWQVFHLWSSSEARHRNSFTQKGDVGRGNPSQIGPHQVVPVASERPVNTVDFLASDVNLFSVRYFQGALESCWF